MTNIKLESDQLNKLLNVITRSTERITIESNEVFYNPVNMEYILSLGKHGRKSKVRILHPSYKENSINNELYFLLRSFHRDYNLDKIIYKIWN